MSSLVHHRKEKSHAETPPKGECGVESWVALFSKPDRPVTCRRCLEALDKKPQR